MPRARRSTDSTRNTISTARPPLEDVDEYVDLLEGGIGVRFVSGVALRVSTTNGVDRRHPTEQRRCPRFRPRGVRFSTRSGSRRDNAGAVTGKGHTNAPKRNAEPIDLAEYQQAANHRQADYEQKVGPK